MEFAEYIKTPKIDKVNVQESLKKYECSLCITSHHLILSTRREEDKELWILHAGIDHVEKSQSRLDLNKLQIGNLQLGSLPSLPSSSSTTSGGIVTLYCKDLKVLKIEIADWQEYFNVAESIEKLSRVTLSFMYAFFYRPNYAIIENGYTIFKPESEYAKLIASGSWRVSKINETYQICSTYGQSLVVPTPVTETDIIESAAFREDGRFPVMCYKHGDVVLLRCAPIAEKNGAKRCVADEKIINLILGRGPKGYIVDTRQNKQLPSDTYTQWKKVNHGIKIPQDSVTKVMEACNDRESTVDKYLERLHGSQWLQLLIKTLNTACVVAQCLDKELCPVVLQGEDATLIVSALVQIILNPDCRTIRGFIALIDREFLQGGYPFSTRHRYFCYSPQRNKNSSPGFLLFLDCVYQLHYQFIWSFEFKPNLLEMLFDNSYASQYGTFIGDCEKEREDLGINKKTTSYWTHLLRPEILRTVLNPIYDPNPGVIWPSVAQESIEFWSQLYCRWTLDQTNNREKWDAIQAKVDYHKELRLKVIEARKKLLSAIDRYEDVKKRADEAGISETDKTETKTEKEAADEEKTDKNISTDN